MDSIKGILFDVDGTLYYKTPLRLTMIFLLIVTTFYNPKELFRKLKIIKIYRNVQEILRFSSEAQGKSSYIQIVDTAKRTGESPSYILNVIEEWFQKKPLPFIRLYRRKGVNKSLEYLHNTKFKLGVFSDYPVEGKLHALGIKSLLSAIVSAYSPEVDGFKPRTNGFLVAAEKMELKPSEILYVGDRPEVDGVGASDAGMHVVILRNIFDRRNNYEYPTVHSFNDLLKIVK